ncbi:MAG: NAD(P)H-dependent oxidoreductase subunit E [Bacteroidales bacterium]|nr:NAD(P)H-dependent oxidoreductase subunit E [Bacteroidales bacterium]
MPESLTKFDQVRKILEEFPPRREYVLKALHKIQTLERQQFISFDMIDMMSEYFKLTKGELYGIIGYYSMLSDEPRAPILIQVCTTPPCHFMEGQKWYEELKNLNDSEIFVEEAACLGHCEMAPVVAVNGEIISLKEFEDVKSLISYIKKRAYESANHSK